MMPKVFIIVLNWNGCSDTVECIESLKKINYPDYKIVVVDNGSTDDSLEVIPKKYFQDIAFIETKFNLGFAGGNNIGIKYALDHGADYILLLNNDTEVDPDFLAKLVEAAEFDKKVGIAGPMIMFYDKPDAIWFGGGKVNWLRTKGEHVAHGLPLTAYRQISGGQQYAISGKQTDYITGCCLLIKREVIEKIGLMSEDYFLYYEDADWCLKAKEIGYKIIYVPQSKIWHKASVKTKEGSPSFIYYHTRNGLLFSSRFGFKPLTYLVSFWIFLKQVAKLAIGYKRDWARPVMKGVLDFWGGKKGKYEEDRH